MPANFRTYEGQLRLLTAVIAAHPGLKLDYKEIHKYFGDSTPDGIAFQFRQIKQEANAMRKAGGGGGGGGGSASTPSGGATPKTPRTAGPGRKRGAPGTGKSTASKKAKGSNGTGKKILDDYTTRITDDDSEEEFVPIDMTPSKVRFNTQKLKELEDAMNAPPAPAPGLAPLASELNNGVTAAAAAAYDDDDDLKIIEPTDAGAVFSFASQPATQTSSAGGYSATSWGQSSIVGNGNSNGNGNGNGDSYYHGDDVKHDFDEDDFGEC